MTRHSLLNRTQDEVSWHARRSFLQAAAAWSASGGFAAAQAQARGNIVELRGRALLNGRSLDPRETIQTGDEVRTGPGSQLVFVIGNSSFLVRQNSILAVERGPGLFVVGALRLLTGAMASVWGKGARRQIVTPTLTAGIRGTGVYAEVFPKDDYRSYFCNCYGTVDLDARGEKISSTSDYHQSFWAEPQARDGRLLTPAGAINHTDEELEFLAQLVQQRTNWQVLGRKGMKDGRGYMDEKPEALHPAAMPR
jgi:hypothetical protein